MKKLICTILAIAMIASTMGIVAFAEEASVANTTQNATYTSLKTAISEAAAGDVLELSGTFEEGTIEVKTPVTVKAAEGKEAVVVDTIQINNLVSTDATVNTLTFEGITFSDCLGSWNSDGCHNSAFNLVVKNCKFIKKTGTMNNILAVNAQWNDVTIIGNTLDCTNAEVKYAPIATNGGAKNNITITGNTITGASRGINTIIAENNLVVSGNTISLEDSVLNKGGRLRGIQLSDDSNSSGTKIAFTNNTITNADPAVEADAVFIHDSVSLSESIVIDVTGTSAISGTDAAACALLGSESTTPATFKTDAGIQISTSTGTTTPVAQIGDTYYKTIQNAIDAAEPCDTIILVNDLTIADNETVTLNNVNLTAAEGVTLTVSSKGELDVYGKATLNLPLVSGDGNINFNDGAIITDSLIGGGVLILGVVKFRGDNTFDMIYDFGAAYSAVGANWTVEPGASVTLTATTRHGLGYGDVVTVKGTLTDALTARESGLTNEDASFFTNGISMMCNYDEKNYLTVEDAYVVIGSNNSFGTKGDYGVKGKFYVNFDNSVLDSSRITLVEKGGTADFIFNKSDVKTSVWSNLSPNCSATFTDSKLLATGSGTDYPNKNAGNLTLNNSDVTFEVGTFENTGTITLDTDSSLTAPSITGSGVIEIDVSDYDGYGALDNIINADLTAFSGEIKAVGGSAAIVEFVNGQLTIKASPAGGPIIGYTGEDRIWGETHANAKESYVVKIYSGDTFMGQSSLNNLNNIIDGDLAPTWSVKLNPTNGEGGYWTTTWAIAPSMDNQPTHVALEVDGVEVSRTAIRLNGPDNINKIYAAVTDADGKILSYATSLESAFNKVADGGRIELLRDVELAKAISFTKDIAFTLDGNGYTVKPAKGATEENSVFNLGQGDDSTRATRKYNIENVIFEGWTTVHIVRLQGTTSVISNCTFKNNNQPDGLGLVTITFADVTVENCVFEDNTCVKCIDVNSWGDNSVSDSVITDCVFENNTVSGPGVVLYSDGASLTVKDNKFVSNNVNTTGNAATLYMGFNDGVTVTGNLFERNVVTTTHATTERVAGGIFAGYYSVAGTITNNAFVNNTATGGAAPASSVAYSACYVPGNLDGNYWGGGEPVPGVDFTHEYPTANDLTVEEYYDEYSVDADGNVILADLKPIVSKVVAVQYVENAEESDPDKGLKVYDIVIVAKDEHIINRLNTADLTFAMSSDKIAYEIVAAEDITLTHNTDYPNRYMFNFNGKDNVADTDVALTIGQVRLTGYDAFTFKVADAETTNLVTATTIDDNIVSYYAADGLALNTDVDGDGEYLGIIDTEIAVPTRDLTIKVDFPNTIDKNAEAYQNMTVTISGGDLSEAIEVALGKENKEVAIETEYEKDNAKYTVAVGEGYVVTIANVLAVNNAYTVTVSGAGYRTARHTVTMTDNKQLNFWNNVKDNAEAIEAGKNEMTKNFLAGEIVKDNKINVYDLSAVVSYFGQVDLNNTESTNYNTDYAKYDLNRDGKIDSLDVAYVLVSWNE